MLCSVLALLMSVVAGQMSPGVGSGKCLNEVR
jgi:hypothetical protein